MAAEYACLDKPCKQDEHAADSCTMPLQALWRGTLAGQLLYVPYTTVQFVTLQQVSPTAAHARTW